MCPPFTIFIFCNENCQLRPSTRCIVFCQCAANALPKTLTWFRLVLREIANILNQHKQVSGDATYLIDCHQSLRLTFIIGRKYNRCRERHHRHLLLRCSPLDRDVDYIPNQVLTRSRRRDSRHNTPRNCSGNSPAALIETSIIRFASNNQVSHPFLFERQRKRIPARVVCDLSR